MFDIRIFEERCLSYLLTIITNTNYIMLLVLRINIIMNKLRMVNFWKYFEWVLVEGIKTGSTI